MENYFTGIIVEESLEDNRIINKLEVKKIEISTEDNPADRWHIYTVIVSFEDIENLSKMIKPKWYMHFWKDKKIIAIFKDKKFEFYYDKKETWNDAINYGLSLGIPKEQLDFPIS